MSFEAAEEGGRKSIDRVFPPHAFFMIKNFSPAGKPVFIPNPNPSLRK
jgi:hypothetical protein